MKAKDFYGSMAWRYFSRTILLYYADEFFSVKCCTCGKPGRISDKNIHLGHYKKVFDTNNTSFATAFNECNVGPQCYQCNRLASGRPDEMRKWLVRQVGEDLVNQVEIKSRNFCKLDKFQLDIYAKTYKERFKALVKKKGNPWK